ncbi:MAG: hypothetical protein Q9227_000929 [Pyrenula ochraceoflavens]
MQKANLRLYSSQQPSTVRGAGWWIRQLIKWPLLALGGTFVALVVFGHRGLKKMIEEQPPAPSTLPLSHAAYLFDLGVFKFLWGKNPNKTNVGETNMRETIGKDAYQKYVDVLGSENVCSDAAKLRARSSTSWSPSPSDRYAEFILYPQNTKQVSEVVKISYKHRIHITPYSGGTSLEGAVATPFGGVIIDLSRMTDLVEVRPDDMDATVQAGVDWQVLNEHLGKEHGLFFPPDPGPGARIGGMVAMNCSGPNAYRYGTMKDWVISLTVVLADGTVIKTRGNGRPRKTSAGYDLTRLFVGSSGTLGIVTEATLRLAPKPKNERVAVASFPSTQRALDTVLKLVHRSVPLAAIELLDEVYMDALNKAGFYEQRKWEEKPTLFFKFAGEELSDVQKQIDMVQNFSQEESKGEKCLSFDISQSEAEVDSLWAARKTALWSLLALRDNPDTDGFVSSDVAVPISELADTIEWTRNLLRSSQMKGSILAHAGDGNFHAAILYKPEEKTRAEEIISQIQLRGVRSQGTIAGEHGIGLSFRHELEYEVGKETLDFMRQIKWAVDRDCLLNCDKVVKVNARDPWKKKEGS